MTRFRGVNPLARWAEIAINHHGIRPLPTVARDTNMAKQTTQHPNDAPKTATGMAKIPTQPDNANTVTEIETKRERKTAREVVKTLIVDLCQQVTDDESRSLRVRLLRIDDLTPNQRVAAMQRVIDAATSSLKELAEEPKKVVVANDRLKGLDF